MPETRDQERRVTIGFRAHSGWAAMVALRPPIETPLVVLRTRLQLLGEDGVAQPYHAAEQMTLDDAASYLETCAHSTRAQTRKSIEAAMRSIGDKGRTMRGATLLTGSGISGVPLAKTLASHALIHTAEGEFYRDALRSACEALRISISPIKEKEVWRIAEATLNKPRDDVARQVQELGKYVGPPWRQDEKLCALAAWIAMAG